MSIESRISRIVNNLDIDEFRVINVYFDRYHYHNSATVTFYYQNIKYGLSYLYNPQFNINNLVYEFKLVLVREFKKLNINIKNRDDLLDKRFGEER